MTISMPAASAACRAAQFRGLIFGPDEGMRVPSISIAISWMLTPLFYLFFAQFSGVSRNENPSDIIGLCLLSPAPAAIVKFRPKQGKPFALYAVGLFWRDTMERFQGPKRKWIIGE